MSYMNRLPAVRFDSNAAITEDMLRKHVPSVFAEAAHESRSDKFVPVPTIDILRSLKAEGFEVVGAIQGKTRVPGKADFTKHIIRLRNMSDVANYTVNGTVAEVTLRNGNDGTAAYSLNAMLFRILCLNGMTCKLADIEEVKVGHIGKNVRDDVIEGTFTVVKEAQRALAAPREWSQIDLSREEMSILARSVHQVRFADRDGNVNTPIRPEQLLVPRRSGDVSHDLWTVTNVIQEHAVRGGDTAVRRVAGQRPRRVSSRAVNSIDGNLNLNKAIFQLADEMAALKGAKRLTAQVEAAPAVIDAEYTELN